MWRDFYKQWLDLCFCWLPKASEAREESADEERQTASPNGAEAAVEERPADVPEGDDVDDLTIIKGIGPAIQSKLRGFGIASFSGLAASDANELAAKLGASQPMSTARVQGWIEAARERTMSGG
jgi:predicted flap endonuclease-1-like 5' DNA nuclease